MRKHGLHSGEGSLPLIVRVFGMMAKEWRSPGRLFIELGSALVVSVRTLLHWTFHYLPDVPAILIRLAASAEDPRPYSL